jgi:IS1 family transposase
MARKNRRKGQPPGRKRRSHLWVWAAIDPVAKLLLAVVVGDRSLATAQMLVHLVAQVLAPGVVPLFVSDQLRHYATSLEARLGQREQERTELETELSAVRRRLARTETEVPLDLVEDFCYNAREVLQKGKLDDVRALPRPIVVRVEVEPEEGRLIYNFPLLVGIYEVSPWALQLSIYRFSQRRIGPSGWFFFTGPHQSPCSIGQ